MAHRLCSWTWPASSNGSWREKSWKWRGLHQLRLVVYPSIYKVWYIPGDEQYIAQFPPYWFYKDPLKDLPFRIGKPSILTLRYLPPQNERLEPEHASFGKGNTSANQHHFGGCSMLIWRSVAQKVVQLLVSMWLPFLTPWKWKNEMPPRLVSFKLGVIFPLNQDYGRKLVPLQFPLEVFVRVNGQCEAWTMIWWV